jgi:hypothetical protein
MRRLLRVVSSSLLVVLPRAQQCLSHFPRLGRPDRLDPPQRFGKAACLVPSLVLFLVDWPTKPRPYQILPRDVFPHEDPSGGILPSLCRPPCLIMLVLPRLLLVLVVVLLQHRQNGLDSFPCPFLAPRYTWSQDYRSVPSGTASRLTAVTSPRFERPFYLSRRRLRN